MQRLVFVFLVLFIVFTHSSNAIDVSWNRTDFFGSLGLYNAGKDAKTFGLGIRYTPILKTTHDFRVKTFAGFQMFKDEGQKPYHLVDYGVAGQFHQVKYFAFDLGGGAKSSLNRKENTTNPFVFIGAEYKLDNPIFNVFDRLILNMEYVFNQSDLYVINYGLSAQF